MAAAEIEGVFDEGDKGGKEVLKFVYNLLYW